MAPRVTDLKYFEDYVKRNEPGTIVKKLAEQARKIEKLRSDNKIVCGDIHRAKRDADRKEKENNVLRGINNNLIMLLHNRDAFQKTRLRIQYIDDVCPVNFCPFPTEDEEYCGCDGCEYLEKGKTQMENRWAYDYSITAETLSVILPDFTSEEFENCVKVEDITDFGNAKTIWQKGD